MSGADRVLGALATANQPTDDTGAELTERTTAVLTAYRELTNRMNARRTEAQTGTSRTGHVRVR